DGKDGPWSTFRIEVGTPSQQVRVLPASDQSTTWLVLPEACPDSAGKDCGANRGSLYKRNLSSTWEEYGSYELNTFLEERVGLKGDGLYGYETLSLGWTGDGLPSLDHQLVAGIITNDFYLGSLSLNPRPNNFTDYNNPIPSLMQGLRNTSTPIPSLSWSYTAGSFNLAPKVFGSLVLGGYDTSRFRPNEVVFPFGADISLDFQVAIQTVTTNMTDTPLLSTGIISYIDSLVSDIWLPLKTCALFEEAFGLVWDNTTQLYMLNDTLHETLLEKNPTVSFKVGPQVSGASVTIDMPYWNFYHTATSAYVGNSSGLYFPLKRAENDTQYVLGRTFLQSAHISADYERNTFNLSQALYPSSSTSSNIVAILPPSEENLPPSGGDKPSSSKSGLGTGAIAGIAVGGFVVLTIIATILFIVYRRKKKTKGDEAHEL
ncbi:acid protease, partial [Melanomma pulvis-pyrius CBS 109.77]